MQVLRDRSNEVLGTPASVGAKKSAIKSPLPTRRRALQTPGSKGVQTPNNDQREKQQARNNRTAAAEGRSLEDDLQDAAAVQGQAGAGLSHDQLAMLYQNCLKMASENKITKDNTWALPLIDHISDLVRPSKDEGNQTNFQRASLTLAAGVVIYSQRVDSVHNDAFKVLGGLSRSVTRGATIEEDGEADRDEGGETEGGSGDGRGNKRQRRDAASHNTDPSSTLEPNFEALNVKKFDLAFAVDPLFHKTSAQFDEGGAKGLLLNNLSVYKGCTIIFDSQEVPDSSSSPLLGAVPPNQEVELGPLAHALAKALDGGLGEGPFPALAELQALAGTQAQQQQDAWDLVSRIAGEFARDPGSARLPREASVAMDMDPGLSSGEGAEEGDSLQRGPASPLGAADAAEEGQAPMPAFEEFLDSADFDAGDDEAGEDWSDLNDPAGTLAGDSPGQASSRGAADSDPALTASTSTSATTGLGEEAVQWLMGKADALSGKDWAGAGHWRFRPVRARQPSEEEDTALSTMSAARKTGARKQKGAARIDFAALPEVPEDKLKQAGPKEISLASLPARADTLLPEDLHYKVNKLMEFFLKPGKPLVSRTNPGAGAARPDDDAGEHVAPGGADFGFQQDYDDLDDDQGFDPGWEAGPLEASQLGLAGDLAAPVRKVAQISVNYARTAKQVDVRALKESLWERIHDLRAKDSSPRRSQGSASQEELSFQDLIGLLPENGPAGRLSDLSVHLCFICLLHLANEHGLRIRSPPSLDRLCVSNLPPLAEEVLM